MVINNNKYPVQSQITPAIAPAVAAAINNNAVADNVKSKVVGITERLKNLEAKSIADLHQVKDAAGRFQNNFGHVSGGNSPGNSAIDTLQGISGPGRSRNPIDQQGLGIVGDRNSHVSEDPAAGEPKKSNDSPDWWGGVKEAFGEIVGEVAGAFGGAAWDILSANDTPEGKKDEANGIIGVFRQGKTGTSNENAASQLKDIDYGGEPLPDDQTPSGVVYGHDIKGINARKGAAGEPTGDEGSTGGAVNTGANGTGRQASLGQPVPDAVTGVAVTARDIQAIQIRLESRINVIR